MAKKKVVIGEKVFGTQLQAEGFVREILRELEPQAEIDSLSPYWDFFHDLIENHPEYEQKYGPGISKFLIGRSFQGHLELNLLWINNEPMDISWKKCISGRPSTPLTNLKGAMRVAIKGQIDTFRNQALEKGIVCGICGNAIEEHEDLHIDHEVSFQKLVQNFNLAEREYPIDFDDGPITHQAIFKDRDKDYSKKWEQYHRENAVLRIAHSSCNLSRKKSEN